MTHGNSSLASPRIIVRTVREQDLAPLAEALAPEVGASQAAHRWQEHCDGHREMLVAELDGRVVGTVSMDGHGSHRPGSLRMFALDVGPAFRRRGVGSALMAAVEEEARQRGLRSVHLEVAMENHDAIRLYERLDYQRQGEPVTNCWWRLKEDGSHEQVRELSHVMVKRL